MVNLKKHTNYYFETQLQFLKSRYPSSLQTIVSIRSRIYVLENRLLLELMEAITTEYNCINNLKALNNKHHYNILYSCASPNEFL